MEQSKKEENEITKMSDWLFQQFRILLLNMLQF